MSDVTWTRDRMMEQLFEMERVLAINAYLVYSACLIGDPPPLTKRLLRAIRTPIPGDVVVEKSTIYRREKLVGDGGPVIGKLIKQTREPIPIDPSAWDDTPIPTEDVYYIERLDGTTQRVVNASFIRVLENLDVERRSADE